MILVCAMSSLSLRERVSAEQTGEGLAFNAMGSSPSSGRSATTFSCEEKEDVFPDGHAPPHLRQHRFL